eukprot:gene5589-6319_t
MGCGSSTIEKPDVSIAKSEHGSIKKLRSDWEFMDLQIAVFVKDLKTDTALEISPLSTVCIDRVEGTIHV